MSSSEEAQTAHHEPPSDDLQASAPPPQSPRHQEQQQQQQPSLSTTSYFTFPVTHVVSGLYRRLTDPAPELPPKPPTRTATEPMNSSAPSVVFTPRRTASPFQPPPLTPLTLNASPAPSTQLLTHALAEEIRLLVPPRLQLVDTWTLAYSLDRDGSSLSTLFEKSSQCAARSQRAGYVLVVKNVSSGNNSAGVSDSGGGGGGEALFGAYLTDPPRPASHYYGTGECFLWRASTLASTPLLQVGLNGYGNAPGGQEQLDLTSLPPPPSADTTDLRGRSTTFKGENLRSGTSTPDRIRFKAFPYSGVNDYMILCETGFLSVGGGDGHYGLWLDDSFEKGVSSPCLTFGNEPLCDEGTKFDVLNVELWYIGN
ncbi:TLD domain-containing protein [Coccidioides immitis RS]|uniref:Oxidation resistance protein 1 n=3 Tax=Coccidioides immitis TaxID=5501 RepID=A0A0E1RV24_COCIM|nr:TLD domain-containing protein [Coccidioides immitis RS]EAS28949.1 TLD domain-containing protein [Coccidioides immitis RS]KMP06076.1 oxidation resistance protein 1 [Coccidioides immitis RMSCC 2394]KMU72629.1 oxidation resistance protein 1 [Coccidioides immitis RMSCC 3703]TPX22875.1 oxidation resistance protein 1 [Coccidioides immitis]